LFRQRDDARDSMVDYNVLLCEDRARASRSWRLPISSWAGTLRDCFFTELSQRLPKPSGYVGHCRILDPCITRLLENSPGSRHLISGSSYIPNVMTRIIP